MKEEAYIEDLQMYDGLNENQLYHYYEPDPGLFIAESPKVILRALDDGYQPLSFFVEKSHLKEEARQVLSHPALNADRKYDSVPDSSSFPDKKTEAEPDDMGDSAQQDSIPVYVCNREVYSSITGLGMTRGMISVMRRRPLADISSLLRELPVCPEGRKRRITILDNVENPTNVGAIFRSAAALNMDAVILTSSCSDPLYRRAARVSMGTVFQIPWTYFKGYTPSKDYYNMTARQNSHNPLADSQRSHDSLADSQYFEVYHIHDYIDELHALGYKVCAMALTEDSVSLQNPGLLAEDKLAIILGNEGVGLPDSTIARCDYTVMIPMAHGVDSLNVAAASAVAFYALTC